MVSRPAIDQIVAVRCAAGQVVNDIHAVASIDGVAPGDDPDRVTAGTSLQASAIKREISDLLTIGTLG